MFSVLPLSDEDFNHKPVINTIAQPIDYHLCNIRGQTSALIVVRCLKNYRH